MSRYLKHAVIRGFAFVLAFADGVEHRLLRNLLRELRTAERIDIRLHRLHSELGEPVAHRTGEKPSEEALLSRHVEVDADFEDAALRLDELPVLYVVRGDRYLVLLRLRLLELVLEPLENRLRSLLMLFDENLVRVEPLDDRALRAGLRVGDRTLVLLKVDDIFEQEAVIAQRLRLLDPLLRDFLRLSLRNLLDLLLHAVRPFRLALFDRIRDRILVDELALVLVHAVENHLVVDELGEFRTAEALDVLLKAGDADLSLKLLVGLLDGLSGLLLAFLLGGAERGSERPENTLIDLLALLLGSLLFGKTFCLFLFCQLVYSVYHFLCYRHYITSNCRYSIS